MVGLADRDGNGGNRLNMMIFISLLLHTGVLFVVFFAPSFPSPKMTFGPVYDVALVSYSARPMERKSASAGMKEILKANRSEEIVKKRLETGPAIPIRRLDDAEKQDRTLERAMEEIRRRAAAEPASSKPAPNPAKAVPSAKPSPKTGAAATDTEAGSTSPSAGDADTEAKINAYYAAIWSRIKRNWALPEGILPGDALEEVVDVTILRSGTIAGMSFEKRSGNRFFDDSTLKAIRKASPFPPIPAWVGDATLAVGIRFHSSELGP